MIRGKIYICFILQIILILQPVSLQFTSITAYSGGFDDPMVGDDSSTRAEAYIYHNYSQMGSELSKLNQDHPDLIELTTAQDEFGVPDCASGYKIWIVRITNESVIAPKPELLYVGGHHGDEPVSIEAAFYFIEWLLTNYYTDTNVRYIVDTRELYIIPVLNPYGWENNIRYDGNGEDINRDYPYGNDSANEALTTVGARAMHELMKVHAFQAGISWHSGAVGIYYAWGSPLHDTATDESPDDKAFRDLGERLSNFAGSFQGKYVHGPANQVIYGAPGAWSDYAYAFSWDPKGTNPLYPTEGARMLAIGVEISSARKPPVNFLGTKVDIYGSPDDVDGFIPKNIRLAFAMADLVQPYVQIQERYKLPKSVGPGENLTVRWKVGGCISVDATRILHGSATDPVQDYEYATDNLTGTGGFSGWVFSQNITMPEEKGRYYFAIIAKADSAMKVQADPEPSVPPQSIFTNTRTNASYTFTIDGRTVNGKIEHYSEIISVEVIHKHNTSIEILSYPESGFIDENIKVKWEVMDSHEVHNQEIRYSNDVNVLPYLGLTMKETITKLSEGINQQFEMEFPLPFTSDFYYFMIQSRVEDNITVYSESYSIFVKPIIEPENITGTIFTQDWFILRGRLTGCEKTLNITVEISQNGFDYSLLDEQFWIFTDGNGGFGITLNAPPTGGEYLVRIRAVFENKSKGQYFIFVSNAVNLIVHDRIFVTTPVAEFDLMNRTISITGITATCSNTTHGKITSQNTITHEILIIDQEDNGVMFAELLWSGSEWFVTIEDTRNLTLGSYFVIASFWDGYHLGESVHLENDSSEFEVVSPSVQPTDGDDDQEGFGQYFLLISAIIVMIIIAGIILLLYTRKKQDQKKIRNEGQDITEDE